MGRPAPGDAATARRDRGAVLPLVAVVLTTLILFASFALDLGYQRVMRRDLQALADVMALDLTRSLGARTEAAILADPTFLAAKAASLDRNDDRVTARNLTITVDLGTVDASGNFVDTAASAIPTAVRVTAAGVTDNFFRPGTGSAQRSAVGVVASNAQARFRVGSNLAAINPQSSSVIGQLLNDLVPGASLLSYQGLATANIGLGALGVALGIPLTTASPDQLLNTSVGFNQLAVAAATVLQNQGNTAAATALQNFINLGVPSTSVNLGSLLGVESGQGGPGLGGTINAAQLLTTTAFLADGDHFVTIPNATLGIPGLTSVGLRLTGIEAPREGGNNNGATRTTSQIDLEITPQFNLNTAGVAQQICSLPVNQQNALNALLGGVLNLVSCTLFNAGLGPGVSQLLSVQVTGNPTIRVSLAEVTVSQSIDCPKHPGDAHPHAVGGSPDVEPQPRHRRHARRDQPRQRAAPRHPRQRDRHGDGQPADLHGDRTRHGGALRDALHLLQPCDRQGGVEHPRPRQPPAGVPGPPHRAERRHLRHHHGRVVDRAAGAQHHPRAARHRRAPADLPAPGPEHGWLRPHAAVAALRLERGAPQQLSGAPRGIRTLTVRGLNPPSLPVGVPGPAGT